MKVHQILVGIAIGAVIILGTAATVQAAPPVTSAEAKIGPGVREQIRTNGSATVMIALKQSPIIEQALGGRVKGLDMAVEKSRIADMQNDILARLGYNDYEERHTYSGVPALAGHIKSEAGLATLARNPNVVKIDIDIGFGGALAASVPVVAADLRHADGNTGEGVVVAVIDSGIDTDHSNLADDLIAEACFADDDGSINGSGRCPNGSDRQFGPGAAEDDAGHGTHVAGIITSNGTLGSVGVAPDAGIVVIKVTWGPSFSGIAYFFSEMVAAVDYIINNPQLGVQVVNISLGADLFLGDCDNDLAPLIAMAAAINTLRANDVTTFAAAGNGSFEIAMSAPACISSVISVGASDNSDVAAGFTNSSASTDIFAPGVHILSSAMGNSTTHASGTSMSSPIAAGCAALLIEAGDAVTPDQIEALLESSPFTVTVPASGLTFPRVDCSPLPIADTDGDGVLDDVDNCPTVPNPGQEQTGNNVGGSFGDACVDPNVNIPDNADIAPDVVIGGGSTINKGITVESGTEIGENVDLNKNSSVGKNTFIGDDTTINQNVEIGDDVVIGVNVVIGSNVVIGNGVTIDDNTVIGQRTTRGPAISINDNATIGINVNIGKDVEVLAGTYIPDGTRVKSGSVWSTP